MNKILITDNAALTMQDIAKWCMVGGKDADYIIPATFDKSWNHQHDNRGGGEWHNTIQKETNNMTKREVWTKSKKDQIPNNHQLIGSKWFFKKKENGEYQACLYRL